MPKYKNIELNQALTKVSQQGYLTLPAEPPQLRVSSLPFCPLLHVLDTVANAERRVNFEQSFYFNIGHAVHNLWQTVAPIALPKQLIGDWQCQRVLVSNSTASMIKTKTCNHIVRFCNFAAVKHVQCPHGQTDCHQVFKYRELEFAWKDLTGHTDFIWRSRSGHYSLVDFKTTSSFLFNTPKLAVKLGYYPSAKYLEQVIVYCLILERNYKIRLKDYTIAYQARESATTIGRDKQPALRLFTYRLTNTTRRQYRQRIKNYLAMFKQAQIWLQAAKQQRRKTVGRLFAARPCHRRLDYQNKMAHGFFTKTPCPHYEQDHCFGKKPKMLKILQKLAVK